MHYKMRKDGNLNDVILILQMKQGDEQAFDKFVRKYYGDILSYCKYHCLDQMCIRDRFRSDRSGRFNTGNLSSLYE